jgi:hypothetical protein
VKNVKKREGMTLADFFLEIKLMNFSAKKCGGEYLVKNGVANYI